jgi:hypothetical protein
MEDIVILRTITETEGQPDTFNIVDWPVEEIVMEKDRNILIVKIKGKEKVRIGKCNSTVLRKMMKKEAPESVEGEQKP